MRLVPILILFVLVACVANTPPRKPAREYTTAEIDYIESYKAAAGDKRNYKIGTPYQINNEWYFPEHEPTYEAEGLASWYGPGLEGNPTANGEIFDSTDFTAAHTTLPMPSIVEVTNLDNGRVVNVRVNDRGPFHSNRVIDVSSAAADALGMKGKGTARVRVKLLPRETLEYMKYAVR